jgi:hypothetical protein
MTSAGLNRAARKGADPDRDPDLDACRRVASSDPEAARRYTIFLLRPIIRLKYIRVTRS